MMQKIRDYFSNFSWFDWLIMAFAVISIFVSSILLKSSALTIICSLMGVIYVILWSKRYKIALIFCLIYVSLYIWQSVNYQNWGEVIQSAFSLMVAIILIFCFYFNCLYFFYIFFHIFQTSQKKVIIPVVITIHTMEATTAFVVARPTLLASLPQ